MTVISDETVNAMLTPQATIEKLEASKIELLLACNVCNQAITEMLAGDVLCETNWANLRVARHLTRTAIHREAERIAKAEKLG